MAITISGSGIVEANLADNAVTLAKMAGGTDGQIITYDASGNPAAVGPGTDGQVLTSTGSTTPPAFEAAAGGGKVLQVLTATFSGTQIITSEDDSFTDITSLSVSITPSATTSKILIMVSIGRQANGSTANCNNFIILRDSTRVGNADAAGSRVRATYYGGMPGTTNGNPGASFSYLDEPTIPGTPVAITYKVAGAAHSTADLYINRRASDSDTVDAPSARTASNIIVMEIGA
jgi:hypothetical protein